MRKSSARPIELDQCAFAVGVFQKFRSKVPLVSKWPAGGYSQVEIVLKVADGDPSRIAPLVTEVIASKVDVLFAIGPAVVRAARSATQTLPIIANGPGRYRPVRDKPCISTA
jgi:hypothetical protein